MKYLLSIILVLGVSAALARQQETPPVIGEPLPDFSFDIRYDDKHVNKASALRGKPVMFIFFGKGCLGSFQGLPKINALYKKYKNRMEFVGMATTSRDNIKDSYERYRKHYQLEFPVAIDSVAFKQLNIYSFSTLVLVDAAGIVKAVTYSISEEALEQFLTGEPFFFHDISQKSKQEKRNTFDPRKPAFVNGNGGDDNEFLQRSLVSEWKPGMARNTLLPFYNGEDPFTGLKSLDAVGRSLAELYRIAYFGRGMAWFSEDTVAYGNYHFNVVLELRDTSRFAYDLSAGKNMYNYTQVLQPHMRTKENMMRIMQADLKNCFGYEVSVETRKMPYLRLIARPGAAEKLKAAPGKRSGKGNKIDGIDFYRTELSRVISIISSSADLSTRDLPLIDETGITGPIDISVKGVMTSLEDVTRALRSQGLDIVRGEREMKVIVIRDSVGNL